MMKGARIAIAQAMTMITQEMSAVLSRLKLRQARREGEASPASAVTALMREASD